MTLASGAISQVVEPTLWGAVTFASTQYTIPVEAPSADLSVSLGSATGTITAGPGRRSVTLTTSSSDTGNLAFKVSKARAGTVSFGRIKVEGGAYASALVARSRPEELRLCQRYFQAYRRTGVNGLQTFFFASMWGSQTSWGFVGILNLKAPMCTAPTYEIGAMSTYTIGTPGVQCYSDISRDLLPRYAVRRRTAAAGHLWYVNQRSRGHMLLFGSCEHDGNSRLLGRNLSTM